MDYVIGMDCGTTNIKAIILSSQGEKIAEASRPNVFITPAFNRQEQDANAWWDEAVSIFREITEKAGVSVCANIRGICISSHTVTMLPVNERGVPLRNAMTYQDGRSFEELAEIIEKVGRDRFIDIVGGEPSVAFLPNKIYWFKKYEPELFEKTAAFIQASSYINYKLTGVLSSDYDQATRTQCLDVNTMQWSEEIGEAIGVDLKEKLPPLKQIDEVIGYVTKEASMQTGIPEGIPVLAGCSDAMASVYATGMTKLGDCGEASGTTSLVFVGSEQKVMGHVPVSTRPCAFDDMNWVFDAPIQTSGAALKWYIEKFAAEEKMQAEKEGINVYDLLNKMALKTTPGAHGLLFFPYLLGERAPLWNDYATGMFIGLKMDTSREDLIRAIFEGTAYAVKHVISTVKEYGGKVDSLRICGGGAKSKTWCMIKASMLHVPVLLLDEESGDVPVGDALIVGKALGIFEDMTETVKRIVKVKEIVYPVPEWEEAYEKLYPFYVNMYQKLDGELRTYKKTTIEITEQF